MGRAFIQELESFLPPKEVGLGLDIIIPAHQYNSLEQQLKCNPETGEIIEIYQQPTGPSDAVAIQHDVHYSSCSFRQQKYGENEKKCKHKADRRMVKSLDSIPWKKDSGGTHWHVMQ